MKTERLATGIEDLDVMLAGGFLDGSVNLVKGAPGTGKTTLGLEFIVRGIVDFGEPGLIITFEQFPEQMRRDAAAFGFDLSELESAGSLRTIFTSPRTFLSEIQKPGGAFDAAIIELGARRLLIDSISHLELLSVSDTGLRETVYKFVNGLKRFGTTVLMTQEDTAITGDLAAVGYGLSYIVDTVIQLRYVEFDSTVARALFILKQRASDHDKSIRQYQITAKGIKVELPFVDRQGLLSGSALLVPEKAFIRAFGGKG